MREVERGHPSIRIHLFGEFIVERLLSSPTSVPRYEQVPHEEWRSRGPAMALLKVLVCHPRRRASRDTLIDLLWPPNENGECDHAFDSAVSILRKVLRTQQGESLLTKVRSGGITIYALPNQRHIWVDADAFEHDIDQAMKAERCSDDALPLWEAAHEKVTGQFLEDDLYSGWAEARRHILDAAHHRCLYRLVDLYLAQNLDDQAETLLQEVVLDDPTDEDALCRLLRLLERQERYQEGFYLYQQSVRVLDEEYHTHLSASTTAIAERLRDRPMLIAPSDRVQLALPSMPSPAQASFLNRTPSRRQMLQELLGVASAALLTPPHALLNPDAWERLSTALAKPSSIDEGVLGDLESITSSYWRLRANTSSTDLLNGVVGHFQSTIQLMRAGQTHPAHERLCSLTGEIAQMIGTMLFEMQDYASAWTYYKFSLNAAHEVSNEELHAVGLGRLSLLLAASGQFSESIVLLQKAQDGTIHSAMIRSWLAVVEAEGQAQLQDADACVKALERAEQIIAQYALGEDRYMTGFNLSRMVGYTGACYVYLHRPNDALAALQEALELLDSQAIRRKSTLLATMAMAHVQQKEIEEACRLAHQALLITRQTRSIRVLTRIRRLQETLEPWKTIPLVKDLGEHITTVFTTITS